MNIRSIITFVLVLVIIALGASAIFIFNKNKAAKNLADTNIIQTTPGIENQGKVMIGIKDAGADIAGVTAIALIADKMEIHHQTEGWIVVANNPGQAYDLLALKNSGATALLAQASVNPGVYDQLRLTINKVTVTKNGASSDAKLPSNEVKITGILMVETGKTSTVVFDIVAQDSLHTTDTGKFIFAPVVKLETQSGTDASTSATNDLIMTAGHVDTHMNAGMNVDGQMITDFMLNSDIKLSEVGNVIKIGDGDEKDTAVKIDAATAINTAINNKYLDSVSSIAFVVENGKKMWVVSGLKNIIITTVYLDAVTGIMVNY